MSPTNPITPFAARDRSFLKVTPPQAPCTTCLATLLPQCKLTATGV